MDEALLAVAALFAGLGLLGLTEYLKYINGTHKNDQINVALEQGKSIIDLHIEALVIQYMQKVYRDKYDKYVFDAWHKEWNYFIRKIVMPELTLDLSGTEFKAFDEDLHEHFLGKLDSRVGSDSTKPLLQGGMTGIEFEIYCENIFRDLGWSVQRTPATGDQGADLLLQYESAKVAVQCKYKSSPVGNSAIQEVVAARVHYGGTHGLVISNQDFTKGARQLAATNRVALIHPDEAKGWSAEFLF